MSCISNKLFRIEVTNAKQLFHGTTNYENKAKKNQRVTFIKIAVRNS